MTDPRSSQLVLRVPEDLPSPFDQIRSSVVGAVTGIQLPSDCTIFDKLNNNALTEPQSKSVEANTEVQNAKTTVELLDALEKVFKPRDIERTRAINSIVQTAKDSAEASSRRAGAVVVAAVATRAVAAAAVAEAVASIGDALYTGHFFAVRDVGYDYLLGSDFMARYAVKPLYYRSLLELGCAKGATNKRPRSYQRVPMFFTGRNMRLAVKGPSILR
ncbi:hypothetical protein WJX75_008868 [Coccomyxa subellipsoidea]|uniref:Uncharacterized protein n=1 Tax=Coccomyxa subellipsoidea TaxID=248742 RepID=A0ABR2YAN7_9CHLO